MAPPVAGSDAQRVAILHIVDVAYHPFAAVAEAGVGMGNGVHYCAQRHAVGVETVTPSQGGVGPVYHKQQFVVAFAYPVHNVFGTDSGVSRCGFAHGGDSLRESIDVFPPAAPVVVVHAVHHHTGGGVEPAAKVAVMHPL